MKMPKTRDPRTDELVREIDALIRLYDVTELHRLREKLAPKWWESGLRVLLFVAGLGFLITIYKLIPSDSALLFGFVFGWFLLFVLALLASIEYLLLKIHALSRLYEWQTRIIDHLIKQSVGAAKEKPEETGRSSDRPL
ncbi:MAG: hypothetical protein N2Z21_04320 [Candidatus Sumerlaeaceae bacterium]|nr:hypothetical protein [Candidatus Sumerlaeaceae bacterium]